MRIAIDLQAIQSPGSRHRGIGRYSLSLVKAITKLASQHEVILVLANYYPETITPIQEAFQGIVPRQNIVVWQGLCQIVSAHTESDWRRRSSEMLREAFISNLHVDCTLVCSMFEGFSDEVVTSIGEFSTEQPTAVILYDLIPLIHQQIYLENPSLKKWYFDKLAHLKKADLLLAISESSRLEAIEYLKIAPDRVVNIQGDADFQFKKRIYSSNEIREISQKFGLIKPFMMYTGGIDHRKNLERLIGAYAAMDPNIRTQYQLVVACSASADAVARLQHLGRRLGLESQELIFTGYVSDAELVYLYNQCTLFVFPSWHEGFGLPVLEAMRCGSAVIAANTSSLPEVVGLKEALFDPYSEAAMTNMMTAALTDIDFRQRLLAHSEKQAKQFSWDQSAARALEAIENLVGSPVQKGSHLDAQELPRLAYISPYPPERSGIADYSAQLLPYLSQYYEIELINDQAASSLIVSEQPFVVRSVDWFIEHQERYDRVLYHFGNSTFHERMFALLQDVPGVVVLHDFYLSGVLAHLELQEFELKIWSRELYNSHGYHAVFERFHSKDLSSIIWRYPCSGAVVQNSLGMIVHSQNSCQLATQWYPRLPSDWQVIPLLREEPQAISKEWARQQLGIRPDDFVVCSFGLLGPTKLNHRLIEAFLQSALAQDSHCHLIFVGENSSPEYALQLQELMAQRPGIGAIRITGWVDMAQFQQYLIAADIGVQLRTLSRGETSAAVLDCMNHGLATIVNAHGSMADLAPTDVWRLADDFANEDLVLALEELWRNGPRRQAKRDAAREHILQTHNPRRCAIEYWQAIEHVYWNKRNGHDALINKIRDRDVSDVQAHDQLELAQLIDQHFPLPALLKTIWIDITPFVDDCMSVETLQYRFVRSLLLSPPTGYRIEPIYWALNLGYQFARKWTLRFLDCPTESLVDERCEPAKGDIVIKLQDIVASDLQKTSYEAWSNRGVLLLHAMTPAGDAMHGDLADIDLFQWLQGFDGVMTVLEKPSAALENWLSAQVSMGKNPICIDLSHTLGRNDQMDWTAVFRGMRWN